MGVPGSRLSRQRGRALDGTNHGHPQVCVVLGALETIGSKIAAFAGPLDAWLLDPAAAPSIVL